MNIKRSFSKLNQSEFKKFFHLRIEDRPIKLASKVKESIRGNKQLKKGFHLSKFVFAIGFFFFFVPGTMIPG
jgi:hypothetical protein